jgi:hypothetical protein
MKREGERGGESATTASGWPSRWVASKVFDQTAGRPIGSQVAGCLSSRISSSLPRIRCRLACLPSHLPKFRDKRRDWGHERRANADQPEFRKRTANSVNQIESKIGSQSKSQGRQSLTKISLTAIVGMGQSESDRGSESTDGNDKKSKCKSES